jgi:hypothetical protein
MKTEQTRFIAFSYDSNRSYVLAERLIEKLDAAGIPGWFLRRMQGDWYSVWVEHVRRASGIVVLADAPRSERTGLREEYLLSRAGDKGPPTRTRRVGVPNQHWDFLRPTMDNVKADPLGEERVGDELALQSAVSAARHSQSKFDDEASLWLEAVVLRLVDWGREVLKLDPIGNSLEAQLRLADTSANSASSDDVSAIDVALPTDLEWLRTNSEQLRWAGVNVVNRYAVRLVCWRCGSV